MYQSKSEEELITLVEGIDEGKVFSLFDILDYTTLTKEEVFSTLSSIFIPYGFFTVEDHQELRDKNIVFFYEYYEQALPVTGISGYPLFYSLQMLDNVDFERMYELLKIKQEKPSEE